MPEEFRHLNLQRAQLANPRRRRPGFGGPRPADPTGYARRMAAELAARIAPPAGEVPGFDTRRLLKLTVENLPADELQAIPGLSVVSQEDKTVTVLFATEEGLAEFRRRLIRIAEGRSATRSDVLFAVRAFDNITPEDRTGPALRTEGRPEAARFKVDVELWPLELVRERETMLVNFAAFCTERGITTLDRVNNQAIVLLRLEANEEGLSALLNFRDVRQVDLPPRYQLDFTLLQLTAAAIGAVPAPPPDSPGVVVLDTGLATNHPVLGPAVGDAQGFAGDGGSAADATGHGTGVAGVALYGDVQARAQSGSFIPSIRLFSGRIADTEDSESTQLIENRVANAVAYFSQNYKSKVFNLSFGDERRPYHGGHVDRLAATLDTLARQYGVLFVVSAGNFAGTDRRPRNWRSEYPEYLFADEARIIDPAPALNVLTVGSLAQHEVARMGVRFPNDPTYQPVARRDEPSPFSRTGPGHGRSIKPELVEYGGNFCVNAGAQLSWTHALRDVGELTTNRDFATQGLFILECGTSYSAARVSHLATAILGVYPNASPNLLRALLVAHAEVPEATAARFPDHDKLLRVAGYGRPVQDAALYSSEKRVTLVSEESLPDEQHHFYEVPLPDDFFVAPARRERRITVTLAHCPGVRRTRIEYKQNRLTFRIVRAASLDEVTGAYRQLRADESEPNIPEEGFLPTPTVREASTVQRATHVFRQVNAGHRGRPYFVVVTNRRAPWNAAESSEPYALVVVVEDRSEEQVRFYTQISAQLQARVRERAQVAG